MSARFVNLDRDTPMLLPPDLREWVAKDDLVRFIVDAVEMCDLSLAKVNHRGCGCAQYPPSMMLALLIYCYANGLFSSRQIEQATYSHVSVRYLCGNLHPDHDTIASFRRENGPLLENCFVMVLRLAKELKAFGKLGTVSVDGTKLGSRAGRGSNRKGSELEKEIAGLQEEIKSLMQEAERADAAPAPEAPNHQLAKELEDKQTRCAFLREAKARLEERQKASREQRERQAKGEVDLDPETLSAQTCHVRGDSQKTKGEVAARDKEMTINLVEEESRLMRDAHGYYMQGYNAQVAIEAGTTRSQMILGKGITNGCNDRRELPVSLRRIPADLRAQITHIPVDTGYDNADLIDCIEKSLGVTVLCPPQSEKAPEKTYRLNKVQQRRRQFAEDMRERLKDPNNQQIYRRRSASVEPVFAVLKNVLGFRRFRLAGLAKVEIEFTLVTTAYNLRRLSKLATPPEKRTPAQKKALQYCQSSFLAELRCLAMAKQPSFAAKTDCVHRQPHQMPVKVLRLTRSRIFLSPGSYGGFLS